MKEKLPLIAGGLLGLLFISEDWQVNAPNNILKRHKYCVQNDASREKAENRLSPQDE